MLFLLCMDSSKEAGDSKEKWENSMKDRGQQKQQTQTIWKAIKHFWKTGLVSLWLLNIKKTKTVMGTHYQEIKNKNMYSRKKDHKQEATKVMLETLILLEAREVGRDKERFQEN